METQTRSRRERAMLIAIYLFVLLASSGVSMIVVVGILGEGVTARRLAMLTWGMPFYLLAAGLIALPLVRYRDPTLFDRAQIRVTESGSRRRYAVGNAHWFWAAVAGSVVGSFTSIFLVALCADAIGPGYLVTLVWTHHIAFVVAFGLWGQRRRRSGVDDVHLDTVTRTLILPALTTFGGSRPVAVDDVARLSHAGHTADDTHVSVWVHQRDGTRVLACRWLTRTTAESFTRMLTEDIRALGAPYSPT